MPRKAMKCVIELDVHVIACPGTFLRDYEYVYLNVEMLGLEARTKSVPPTFPLFFHERLRFDRTYHDCTDPSLIAALLKGEDIIIELRQHTDYITDGKVIAHCSSNTHDFLYPAIPSYYGSGREILLYKTSKFKPIRVTGEPVKLEFSTKTTIKEVPDYYSGSDSESDEVIISTTLPNGVSSRGRSITKHTSSRLSRSQSLSPSRRLTSTPNPATDEPRDKFLVRRKDDDVLANRDFSSFVRPKPRRSRSPTRQRKASPTRSPKGTVTSAPLPLWKYADDFPKSSNNKHSRSLTTPVRSASPSRSLRYAMDDLNLTTTNRSTYSDPLLRFKSRHSPNLKAALNASDRIQRRVESVIRKQEYAFDSDNESDVSLDILRESLREERKALGEAIREADREALYRSFRA